MIHHLSIDDGQYYYHNVVTGETTWELPAPYNSYNAPTGTSDDANICNYSDDVTSQESNNVPKESRKKRGNFTFN
jgi:hypothetical protein